MNLYLDDDSADRRLVTMLVDAGHQVVVPADVQLSGASDAKHLIYTMRQSLILLTRNHDDFLICMKSCKRRKVDTLES